MKKLHHGIDAQACTILPDGVFSQLFHGEIYNTISEQSNPIQYTSVIFVQSGAKINSAYYCDDVLKMVY